MELNKNRFSLAVAATMGTVYLICSVFTALWPGVAIKLLGWVAHLMSADKFAVDVEVTFLGLVIGLAQVLVYTYFVAYLFAWLHNRLLAHKV